MPKMVTTVVISILLAAQLASAEDYDSCVSNNDKKYADCMVAAGKFVNDIEVQDAKTVCENTAAAIRAACDDAEANGGGRAPAPDAKPK